MPPAWVRVLLGKCRPQNLDGRNRMLFSQDGQSHKSGIVMDRSQGHHCNERSIRQHGKQANEEDGQSLELMVTGAFRVRGSDEASSKVCGTRATCRWAGDTGIHSNCAGLNRRAFVSVSASSCVRLSSLVVVLFGCSVVSNSL